MTRYKNYKQYTLILLIVTVIALVVCAASFSLKQKETLAVQGKAEQNHVEYYTSKADASQESSVSTASSGFRPTSPPSSAAGTSSAQKEESYLVTVHEGKIGVFRPGESEPFLTADVDVYLLPEEDLSLLKKGIHAESFGAVKSILEDYE